MQHDPIFASEARYYTQAPLQSNNKSDSQLNGTSSRGSVSPQLQKHSFSVHELSLRPPTDHYQHRPQTQLTDSFVHYLNVIDDQEQPRSKSSLLHSRSSQLDLVQQTWKNKSRINIKSNTRNLKNEIHSIDEEIAELQDTIQGQSMMMPGEMVQTQTTTQNNSSRLGGFIPKQ